MVIELTNAQSRLIHSINHTSHTDNSTSYYIVATVAIVQRTPELATSP